MPRKARVESKTKIYHVMSRALNKQILFDDEKDYLKFLRIVKSTKSEIDFDLYGYCIMSNHYHLLIKDKSNKLSAIMNKINSRYANYYKYIDNTKRYDKLNTYESSNRENRNRRSVNIRDNKKNYDLISVILICLGNDGQQSEVKLIKMLSILLSRDIIPKVKKEILQNEFGIPMTKNLESGVADVCNLSQGIVDETTIEHLKNMMETTGWDVDKCMDILKVPTQPGYLREYYKEEIFDTDIA